MEEQISKFIENLPNLIKTGLLLGVFKGIVGIYMIIHKENKQLSKENFELKDENEELKNEVLTLKSKKFCNNCKDVV